MSFGNFDEDISESFWVKSDVLQMAAMSYVRWEQFFFIWTCKSPALLSLQIGKRRNLSSISPPKKAIKRLWKASIFPGLFRVLILDWTPEEMAMFLSNHGNYMVVFGRASIS